MDFYNCISVILNDKNSAEYITLKYLLSDDKNVLKLNLELQCKIWKIDE